MKLIVGLGNPGSKYTWTRHNIGRLLMECIVRENVLTLSAKKKLKATLASFNWGGQSVVVAHSQTYMNHSGECVRALSDYYSVDPASDLLIVVDEFALPFGKMRFRPKGSAGGHNGLKSIETHLGTQEYGRLRLGIGPEAKNPQGEESAEVLEVPLENYVLDVFKKTEKERLGELLVRASQACQLWLNEPPEKTMTVVNSGGLE